METEGHFSEGNNYAEGRTTLHLLLLRSNAPTQSHPSSVAGNLLWSLFPDSIFNRIQSSPPSTFLPQTHPMIPSFQYQQAFSENIAAKQTRERVKSTEDPHHSHLAFKFNSSALSLVLQQNTSCSLPHTPSPPNLSSPHLVPVFQPLTPAGSSC